MVFSVKLFERLHLPSSRYVISWLRLLFTYVSAVLNLALSPASVIENAVRDYKDIPAGCSLDFGVTDDGRTLLIEMNDGLALGCYGLPDEEYAKLLLARWAELNGTKDPFQGC